MKKPNFKLLLPFLTGILILCVTITSGCLASLIFPSINRPSPVTPGLHNLATNYSPSPQTVVIKPPLTISTPIVTTGTFPPLTEATSIPPLPTITEDSLLLLHQENFINPDSGWWVGLDNNVSFNYIDEEYNISVKNSGYIYASHSNWPGRQSDFVVDVDARVESSASDSEYGLLFRSDGNDNYYRFSISGNYYSVLYYFQGECHVLRPSMPSPYIKTDGSNNTLRVSCLGDTIEIFVNAEKLSTLHSTSSTGSGIFLMATGTNTSAFYDNFKVYQFTPSYIMAAAPHLPVITDLSLPQGLAGVFYNQLLTASGGTAPYIWELIDGFVPEGLFFCPYTGVISGIPVVSGSFNFTIRLGCSSGYTIQDISLEISELKILTDRIAEGTKDAPYNAVLHAVGGTPPYTWDISSGRLPEGLVLDRFSGAITGIPAAATGPVTAFISVEDVSGAINTKGFSISVNLGNFEEIDRWVINIPREFETSIHTLVEYLIQPCRNEMDKARVIYRWIVENVRYDVSTSDRIAAGIFSSNPDQSAASVFYRRDGVCEGYSRLFTLMAEYAGLQTAYITGSIKADYPYLKENVFKNSHAWNAVSIDGEWRLLDATWGAGYIDSNNNFIRCLNDFWFLTPPEQFVYTHFPEDSQWQCLDTPNQVSDFMQYPLVEPVFFLYGLQLGDYGYPSFSVNNSLVLTLPAPTGVILSAEVLHNNNKLTGNYSFFQRKDASNYEIRACFPHAGDYDLKIYAKREDEEYYRVAITYHVTASGDTDELMVFPNIYSSFNETGAFLHSQIPGELTSGTSYDFKISVPGASDVAFIQNMDGTLVFIHLWKDGQDFMGVINTFAGDVRVSANFPGNDIYWALLDYTVK